MLLAFLLIFLGFSLGAHVPNDQDEKVLKVSGSDRSYMIGERFEVECLSRTTDTGEHVEPTVQRVLSLR